MHSRGPKTLHQLHGKTFWTLLTYWLKLSRSFEFTQKIRSTEQEDRYATKQVTLEILKPGPRWHFRQACPVTNRFSENSNLNLKFCLSLCNAIWKSCAKSEENLFFHFLFVITFLLIRVLHWKFVWCFATMLRSLAQKNEETPPMKYQVKQIFLTYVPLNLWDPYVE